MSSEPLNQVSPAAVPLDFLVPGPADFFFISQFAGVFYTCDQESPNLSREGGVFGSDTDHCRLPCKQCEGGGNRVKQTVSGCVQLSEGQTGTGFAGKPLPTARVWYYLCTSLPTVPRAAQSRAPELERDPDATAAIPTWPMTHSLTHTVLLPQQTSPLPQSPTPASELDFSTQAPPRCIGSPGRDRTLTKHSYLG